MKETTGISRLMWVYISGIAFILFFALSIVLILFSDRISAIGITKSFYYLILIPTGLCAAAFLFGAMHSYAKYTGQNSLGKLELTGPVVLFALVIIGGFYFAEPESGFLLTIRLNKIGNQSEPFYEGNVIVDLDNQRIKRSIGENGEVLFADVPSRFIGKGINVYPEVKGYHLSKNNNIKIPDNHVIYLSLEKNKDTSIVRGTVIDSLGNPVADVFIDFESGIASVKSNGNGQFITSVPFETGSTILLSATLNGKTGFRDYITIPENKSLIVKFK